MDYKLTIVKEGGTMLGIDVQITKKGVQIGDRSYPPTVGRTALRGYRDAGWALKPTLKTLERAREETLTFPTEDRHECVQIKKELLARALIKHIRVRRQGLGWRRMKAGGWEYMTDEAVIDVLEGFIPHW